MSKTTNIERVDVILDPEPDPGLAVGLDAALVGVALGQRPLPGATIADHDQRQQREGDRQQEEQEPMKI